MGTINLSRAAEQDLIEIYLFGIAAFGVQQADSYADELAAKLTLIADNPSIGADYTFVQNGLRRAEYSAHAIYYRQMGAGILVLRILHGRMDVGRHLG